MYINIQTPSYTKRKNRTLILHTFKRTQTHYMYYQNTTTTTATTTTTSAIPAATTRAQSKDYT